MRVKTTKTKISFDSVRFSLWLSVSLSHAVLGPGKKKWRAEEKKATVRRSTFEASLSGLAAWSCVSKPHRAFHPLCCPRCVQCTGALCGEGDDTSHSVFCPTLGDGELRIGGTTEVMAEKGGRGQKANLQRVMVLQSCCAQRLIKRNFMLSCARCNCGVPEDTKSRSKLSSAPDTERPVLLWRRWVGRKVSFTLMHSKHANKGAIINILWARGIRKDDFTRQVWELVALIRKRRDGPPSFFSFMVKTFKSVHFPTENSIYLLSASPEVASVTGA